MKALVTGASSGIGREIAKYLSALGHGIVAVARDKAKLESLQQELKTPARLLSVDLSSPRNCKNLFAAVEKENIDILVNNAGVGLYGNFLETDLEREMEMIGLNLEAVHILTKLFLQQMVERDSGYIMNVSSLAAFIPGPDMAAYHAAKAYILRLTQSVQEELAQRKSQVHVSALCPTVMRTNFQKVAGVEFDIPNQTPEFVAKEAVDGMFRGKKVIVPGVEAKAAKLLLRLLPDSVSAKTVSAAMRPKKEIEQVQYTWEITEP